jgi:predicted O-methyltransferase YrrM
MPGVSSSKLLRLFALLPQRPREFYNRVAAIVGPKVEFHGHEAEPYQTLDWDVLLQQLAGLVPADVRAVLEEKELRSVEDEVLRGIQILPKNAPFPLYHNADFSLARLCYLLVRIMRPAAVIETGVCYGVTSAFLLQALRVNSSGRLHSIDLPPLGKEGDQFVGRLVPQHLRSDWRLHRGRSVDLLPKVARDLGQVNLFLHDSQHTYRNMRDEFEIVTPYLAPQAVVVADDVEGNAAFQEWVSRHRPSYSAVLAEQSKASSLLGIAVLAGQPSPVISPAPGAGIRPVSSR